MSDSKISVWLDKVSNGPLDSMWIVSLDNDCDSQTLKTFDTQDLAMAYARKQASKRKLDIEVLL